MRTALNITMSLAIKLLHNTLMSSVIKLQKITQKSLEQYQIQQLLLPEPLQLSTTLQLRELILQDYSEILHIS